MALTILEDAYNHGILLKEIGIFLKKKKKKEKKKLMEEIDTNFA